MSDFEFKRNLSDKWTILAPHRAKRPNMGKQTSFVVCPFCVGQEEIEPDVYRLGGHGEDWEVRVIPNKFPFAEIHEVIIHSPDHHKSFGELPYEQVSKILSVYKSRFQTYQKSGQVYIFHNSGEKAGESIPHPHTQLAVLPFTISIDTPLLLLSGEEIHETQDFFIFSPFSSQWPDEVWIVPQKRKKLFGDISGKEIESLSVILTRIVQLMSIRHSQEFPYNFYIYPGQDWYLRLIPRIKNMGGLEVGTGIFVNTQDPEETIQFIKTHYEEMDEQKIKETAKAEYRKSA
jgi:UDPglucose--hexose-1-phosphate uridylyltransferase